MQHPPEEDHAALTLPVSETAPASALARVRHGLVRVLTAAGRAAWRVLRDDGLQALRLMLVLLVLCGGIYPLMLFAIGQAAFPYQANGSLLVNGHGQVIGSTLLEQQFTRSDYFQGRPSAVAYNAAGSGGSNLGPSNPRLITTVRQYADQFRRENGLSADTPLPADIVTASGSGLDPDISVAAAMLQVNRVAAARSRSNARVTPGALKVLIAQQTQGRDLGVLGEPRVNVLALNRALDALFGPPPVAP